MNYTVILQSLHKTLDIWETELDRYSLEQLCLKPAKDSWSLGQVYVHLLSQTLYYNFPQIEECISSDQNSNGEKSTEGAAVFAGNEFPDKKLKGPPGNEDPGQPESVEQVKKGLNQVKSKLALLEKRIVGSEYKGKSLHPGLYYLDAWEWVQFIDIHFRHHLRQKERIDGYLEITK